MPVVPPARGKHGTPGDPCDDNPDGACCWRLYNWGHRELAGIESWQFFCEAKVRQALSQLDDPNVAHDLRLEPELEQRLRAARAGFEQRYPATRWRSRNLKTDCGEFVQHYDPTGKASADPPRAELAASLVIRQVPTSDDRTALATMPKLADLLELPSSPVGTATPTWWCSRLLDAFVSEATRAAALKATQARHALHVRRGAATRVHMRTPPPSPTSSSSSSSSSNSSSTVAAGAAALALLILLL